MIILKYSFLTAYSWILNKKAVLYHWTTKSYLFWVAHFDIFPNLAYWIVWWMQNGCTDYLAKLSFNNHLLCYSLQSLTRKWHSSTRKKYGKVFSDEANFLMNWFLWNIDFTLIAYSLLLLPWFKIARLEKLIF